MKLKYFIYCRRSQDREDQQVLSIESQKRELLAYAKNHGLDVVEVIREDMSAYKRGRPKFNRMMERIEAGEADAVLTWHLTRLARNGADGGLIITFMDEGMIKELRTTEKVYTNTGDDKFMMTIHFAMAKKSSDDTSAFVKNNLKTKLENGEYPGWVPYGYINIGPNGVISGRRFDRQKQTLLEELGRPLRRVELDPIEGPLIRRLLDLALTGAYDLPMLQDEAFKLGIKGKNSGKKLSKETVKGILINKFYTGRFDYIGDEHQGAHEPLLSEVEFQRLQVILSKRSRPKRFKHEYTYSTRVHCPECGEFMSGEYQKGHHYYRCARAKGKNASCANKKHVRQEVLDDEIAKTLAKLKMPQKIMQWGMCLLKRMYLEENRFLSGKRTLLQQNVNEERGKLERLTAKWLSEKNADGSLVSDEYYKEQKGEIEFKLKKHKEQLEDNDYDQDNWLTSCEDFFRKMRNIGEGYMEDDLIGKQIVLAWLEAEFIRKDGKWAVKLGEPFNCYLNPEKSEVSIRTEKRCSVAITGVLTQEQAEWLPGPDSNRRPID